jgi:hypothetical protein
MDSSRELCREPGSLSVSVAACVEEDVLELRVAMRDAFAVDIRDRRQDLLDDALNEVFAADRCRTEVRKACVAQAMLHHEIAIQIIGQERVDLDNLGVAKLDDGMYLPLKVRWSSSG